MNTSPFVTQHCLRSAAALPLGISKMKLHAALASFGKTMRILAKWLRYWPRYYQIRRLKKKLHEIQSGSPRSDRDRWP